jgi:hypothetical protein
MGAGRTYLVVEGHGEVRAVGNLVTRLSADMGLSFVWAEPIRGKAMHTQAGILRLCEILRAKPDCERVLFLRDEDDACPAKAGPQAAGWIAAAKLSFPAAIVLAHREYEVLFLPCLHLMAGKSIRDSRGIERPGIVAGTTWSGDPEAKRDIKGWLSAHFSKGRSYKPTEDQLPLTRMLDFPALRASALPCFLTLERALCALAASSPGEVYPPVP